MAGIICVVFIVAVFLLACFCARRFILFRMSCIAGDSGDILRLAGILIEAVVLSDSSLDDSFAGLKFKHRCAPLGVRGS